MLRVAIVGCGKIADSHVSQIRRIPGCEIVAVCDREPLMAKQLHDRFPVKQCFHEVSDLLSEAHPDVVHITTPPQSHFELAKACLDAGCHVYVEKPFTLDARDAQSLLALAQEKGLKVTAGHDDQFRHAARRMRKLVEDGYLGSAPVHMESYYGYELSGSYADALLSDKQHWVRKLPGKLLHNIISHGIARFAEYLVSDSPVVISHGFASPYLKSRGETEIFDEVRVILSDQGRMTGYFTFSSQMRPALHQFAIYGSKNGLVLDQDQETLVKLRGKRYPSYAEQFVPPFEFAGQYLANFTTNFRSFLRRDFHMKSGMKFLIESFYRSITEGAPLPLSHREILLTASIMDTIFAQLNEQQSQNAASSALSAALSR
jgi:predicted dehydrogenase